MSLFQRLLSAIKDFSKEIWGKLSDEEKEKIIKLIANKITCFHQLRIARMSGIFQMFYLLLQLQKVK